MRFICKNPSDIVWKLFVYSALIIMNIATIYPFMYVLSVSISSPTAVNAGKVVLYPIGLNFTAYRYIFSDSMMLSSYVNTIVYAVSTTILVLFLCTLTAYPLSCSTYSKRNIIMKYFAFTMYFSGGMIPTYLVVRSLGLYDTMWAFILPGVISAFNVIIFRTFFKEIPDSMRESALIDGASEMSIYARIFLPLSKPILATIGLFTMVGQWNNFFGPFLYLQSPKKFPLTLILRRILITSDFYAMGQAMDTCRDQIVTESVKGASIIVTILPIIMDYYEKGKMPNFEKLVVKIPSLKDHTFDKTGNMYGMPQVIDFKWVTETFLTPKQALEKYNNGSEILETFDDIYRYLKAIKADNPQYYPWSNCWGASHFIPPIARLYQTGHGIYYNDNEKQYKFGSFEEKYKQYLQFMNKCFTEGLIDPEFATKSRQQQIEDVANGRAVFLYMYMSAMNGFNSEARKVQNNPDYELVALMPPKVDGTYSKLDTLEGATGWYWIVSSKCKYPDVAIAYLDYLISDEMTELYEWGIEGVTFVKDSNGNKAFKQEFKTATTSGSIDPRVQYGIGNQSLRIRRTFDFEGALNWGSDGTEAMRKLAAIPEILREPLKPLTLNEEDRNFVTQKMAAIQTYIDESALKFITGSMPFSEWDKYVEKLKSMETDKVVEIYNKALKQ